MSAAELAAAVAQAKADAEPARVIDQCCADETVCGEFFSLYGDNLRGSLYNPLRALGLLAIDPTTESSFEPDELAAATGAPTEWFDDEHLCAPLQDVLPALGKLTLVWLSPMRTMALAQGALPGVKED